MFDNYKSKLIIVLLLIVSFGGGLLTCSYFEKTPTVTADDLSFDEQEATIRAIAQTDAAVVNIIVYDDIELTVVDTSTNQEKKQLDQIQKGRGTGFLISSDGYIVTNKHVIQAAGPDGSYRIIMNTGKQYYAQLIGKDPINDMAILKIFDENLPYVKLGDSNALQIGTSVIAIGNALGLYQNSATKGIVSGLGRSIVVNDNALGGLAALDNVIQTDAEINLGNSGGPLINLAGEVVGVNVAVDENGYAIGFAIPINDVRPVINSIIKEGRIIRPRLGLKYLMLNPEMATNNNLPRNTGAWINAGDQGGEAIVKDGPADKAGLLPGDIIFEVNAIKVEGRDTLVSITQRYKPGNKIGLKVQRGEKVLILVVELDEFSNIN